MADGPCSDWKAWIDRMPGVDSTLHVTATCEFPTPGYEASLSRHEPQGANERDLMLDLNISEPDGPQPEVITPVSLDYSEPAGLDYDTVSIFPDGPSGIQVEIVS